MENLTVMIALVLIVIVGFIAGKIGYMNEEFDRKLSALIVNITCPALIISSTMGDSFPDRNMILPLLGISFLTYIILTVVSIYAPRWITSNKGDEGVIGFAMMFGNVGFIGYPIVASIFGNEAVFYAAILNVANTFFVFTVGNMLVSDNGNGNVNGNDNGLREAPEHQLERKSARKDDLKALSEVAPAGNSKGLGSIKRVSEANVNGNKVWWSEKLKAKFKKKVLYSTPMLSAYLSMLIVALGITDVPQAISKPLTMIGNITVPGALLIIGSTMAQLSGKAMLGNVTVYVTSIFRLVLIPLAMYALFTFAGFSPYVVEINTVIIAMPVATYGTILCLINGRDTTLMTELTFTTTILSMITIPLLAHYFGA